MDLNNKFIIDDEKLLLKICGVNNKNLRKIESTSGAHLSLSGNAIYFDDEKPLLIEKILSTLKELAIKNENIYKGLIGVLYEELDKNINLNLDDILKERIEIKKAKKVINPRSINQGLYIKQLKERDIVFSYGPAGTGKTFLAVAFALNELLDKKYSKIILTRPVVEAGESLGFLPGDFIQKINPYLTPLLEAINFILPFDIYSKLQNHNMMEIAPLAYMRGRTFSNSIVILDEAQNTTTNQMKMFLTRLGEKSKLFITGDITQIDLPRKQKSGMIEAIRILSNIQDIGFTQFEEKDVVRNPIVKKIISAYKKYEDK